MWFYKQTNKYAHILFRKVDYAIWCPTHCCWNCCASVSIFRCLCFLFPFSRSHLFMFLRSLSPKCCIINCIFILVACQSIFTHDLWQFRNWIEIKITIAIAINAQNWIVPMVMWKGNVMLSLCVFMGSRKSGDLRDFAQSENNPLI